MSININLKIFLFAIIFYFTKQIEIYALLMIFAILHEIGHLICGLILGLKPKSVKIMPFGISVEFSVICNDYNKKIKNANLLGLKKIIIALAGPVTNLLIVGICLILRKYNDYFWCNEIIYANILIALFNLLPIYPLDGGRCLKSIIHILKGNKQAIEYTNYISNICVILVTMLASIGIYYYKNIAILFIIIYLWTMIIIENKKYNTKKRIYKIIENSWNKTKIIVLYT